MAETHLHVVLCGYGAFGALHAAAWCRRGDVTLSLVEPDATARKRAREEGFPTDRVFSDLAPALEGADVIDIAAPPAFHLPLARHAIEAGKPVMLEKPAVRSVADAARLLALARRHGVPVQIGMLLRCHPLTLRAFALLGEGVIGRLLAVEGAFCGWKRMRADSSLVENDGVHFLDLQRFFAGGPIEAVDATGAARLGGACLDDIEIRSVLAGGVTGRLRLGIIAGGEEEDPFVPGAVTRKSLRLVGTQGVIELDFNRNRLFHGAVRYDAGPGGWTPVPGSLRWEATPGVTPVDLVAATVDAFVAVLRGAGTPVCDIRQGAVELAQVLAGIESALARPAPPIPEVPRDITLPQVEAP